MNETARGLFCNCVCSTRASYPHTAPRRAVHPPEAMNRVGPSGLLSGTSPFHAMEHGAQATDQAFLLLGRSRERRTVGERAVAEDSAEVGTTSADRANDPPDEVSLAPDYLRCILRLEAIRDNASGADKSWVHRAHADAVRHLSSAKRRCESVDRFTSLAGALTAQGVRYVVIGVGGANYYAPSGSAMLMTLDRDLFLPADPRNLLVAWGVCRSSGFELFAGAEPLDELRDAALARAVVERRPLTRASDGMGTDVDLSCVMSGFDFETVWSARRTFEVEAIAIPVARLSHIVASKARAGREKDRLFLATHREVLDRILSDDDPSI